MTEEEEIGKRSWSHSRFCNDLSLGLRVDFFRWSFLRDLFLVFEAPSSSICSSLRPCWTCPSWQMKIPPRFDSLVPQSSQIGFLFFCFCGLREDLESAVVAGFPAPAWVLPLEAMPKLDGLEGERRSPWEYELFHSEVSSIFNSVQFLDPTHKNTNTFTKDLRKTINASRCFFCSIASKNEKIDPLGRYSGTQWKVRKRK